MTPIDTTRLRAHDELRKRLTAYRDAKALYESPDPYDREEARYEAMHVAGRRIGHDEALAQGLLDEVERLRARPTWERVLRIANGCTDYGGGHHGADHEVYQHGIWTVCNVLKNACEQGDKPDMQLRVVEAIGAEALTPGEPEEGGTR